LGRKVVGMITYSFPPFTSNSAFTAVFHPNAHRSPGQQTIGASHAAFQHAHAHTHTHTHKRLHTFFLLAELALAQQV
jgi:hypothetical protein